MPAITTQVLILDFMGKLAAVVVSKIQTPLDQDKCPEDFTDDFWLLETSKTESKLTAVFIQSVIQSIFVDTLPMILISSITYMASIYSIQAHISKQRIVQNFMYSASISLGVIMTTLTLHWIVNKVIFYLQDLKK